MYHKIQALYRLLVESKCGIWTINLFKGSLGLKEEARACRCTYGRSAVEVQLGAVLGHKPEHFILVPVIAAPLAVTAGCLLCDSFCKLGVLFAAVLRIRPLPFGVCITAPDFWKLPFGFQPCCDSRLLLQRLMLV